jgi:hypothetical protein
MTDDAARTELPPAPRKWVRVVRIGTSVFFGLLTVVLVVLWVRSCRRSDSIHMLANTTVIEAWSACGEVYMGTSYSAPSGVDLRFHSLPLSPDDKFQWFGSDGNSNVPTFGFGMSMMSHHGPLYMLPHWFLALLSGCVALFAFTGTSRFSLRTMLTITTLVAAILGLIAWTSS